MRKKISLIILLSVFFSFSSLSFAAEEATPENNANATQTGTTNNNNENVTPTGENPNGENTTPTGENTTQNEKIESLENEIKKVEIIGDNKVKVVLDKYVKFENNYVSGEFKILKEIRVLSNSKTNEKIVKISLDKPIEKNSSYNILDINGNGSIDFTTSENLENTIIKNEDLSNEATIESVKIVNPTNLEINFKNNLTSEDFSFKVFEIMKISNKKGYNSDSEDYIELDLDKNLNKNDNYILTILELKNSTGNKIEFSDNGYKEFSATNPEEEFKTLENNQVEDKQTANTAMQTEQTPDTGTATNVLLILTFILSTIYFIYSRKKV